MCFGGGWAEEDEDEKEEAEVAEAITRGRVSRVQSQLLPQLLSALVCKLPDFYLRGRIRLF